MREQLVCTRCWRWYDDRTTCPTCKATLINAETGKPVTEPEVAPPAPPRGRATPTYYPPGTVPPAPGASAQPVDVSGYPGGTPVAPPTRQEIRGSVTGARGPNMGIPLEGSPAMPSSSFTTTASIGRSRATSSEDSPPSQPWSPHAAAPVADFSAFMGADEPPPPPPPPPELQAGAALASSIEPAVPPSPPPLLPWPEWGVPQGEAGTPPAAPAPGPAGGTPLTDPAAPAAPDVAGPALVPVLDTWDLEPATLPEPSAPVVEPLPWLVEPTPVSPVVAPVAAVSPVPATAPDPLATAPATPATAWPAATPPAIPSFRERPAAPARPTYGEGATAPATPRFGAAYTATPGPFAVSGTEAPAAGSAGAPAAPFRPEETARAAPARSISPLTAAAATLVVGVAVTALWVSCAVKTGMELPELAIVVGGASGLTRGRLGGAGHLGAAVAAALVTLVAVAIGMILAAEAVISSAGSTSFVNAVTTINRSSLGPIWARTGLAGVALGAAGVVVALAAVLLIPGRRSTTA